MGKRTPLAVAVHRTPSEDWGEVLDAVLDAAKDGSVASWRDEIRQIAASLDDDTAQAPDPKADEKKRLDDEIARLQLQRAAL